MDAIADARFMDLALALAREQLGQTAPNPAVGCVLVKSGRIVATGATAAGGRPHAERVALDRAGSEARGATAYVTLEPCAFHGQSGACTDRLIAAGVARVMAGCLDRHPQVAGRGLSLLREAGIAAELGPRQDDAAALYAGFFHRLETGRPLIYADRNPARYDACLDLGPEGDLGPELDRLGQAGMNRVCLDPDAPAAAELAKAGHLAAPRAMRNTRY